MADSSAYRAQYGLLLNLCILRLFNSFDAILYIYIYIYIYIYMCVCVCVCEGINKF